MHTLKRSLISLALIASSLPIASTALAQAPDVPANRSTEPVVLTGDRFPEWAVLGDVALKAPSADGVRCFARTEGSPENPITPQSSCTHNTYEDAEVQSSDVTENPANPKKGVPVERLRGYRWNPELGANGDFEQIPFQVDEMFVRYLSNHNSGFAHYSETDQHTAYAFDREGFRWTADQRSDSTDPMAPCLAKPASEVAKDPVQGLDTDDELVFMYDDSGNQAPADALLPPGVEGSYEVALTDPTTQKVSFAYVMLAGPDGPSAAFDNSNGYVRYSRDDAEDRNVFLYSQSSYGGYGAAPKGPWYDPARGICVTDDDRQRRPSDAAWVTTPGYKFRYEGRWVMSELRVSDRISQDSTFSDLDAAGESPTYGPDLIDQWKARAFQQRPGGQTPCCGYEEEVNNWGGSSILMGERSGPVRVIRETWGADSGTNVVRREIFYRDEIRFGTFLRVHVIPPLDGIYAQWDYNAGRMQTYHNSWLSTQDKAPVAIDGEDDEVFGNSRVHFGQDGFRIDPHEDDDPSNDPPPIMDPAENCDGQGDECIDNDVDSPDPTFSGANQGAIWEQVSGSHATLVWRTQLTKVTPGAAHSVVAVPYYRDDSCFDDGTGSNPGPHLKKRSMEDPDPSRHCWAAADGVPSEDSDRQFWQGSIGTHGVHLLLIADSDNAHTPVPLTEIDSEARAVILPGQDGSYDNLGDEFGRAPEKPLVIAVAPMPARENKQASTIELDGATSGEIGDTVTLSATLRSGDTPLAERSVVFSFAGEELEPVATDADGVATTDVTLTQPAGTTEQSVRFEGDATYFGSSDSAPFEVQKNASALTLSIGKAKSGWRANATLTDADTGQGLAGQTVRFLISGVEVGTAVTNEAGLAGFTGSSKPAPGAVIQAVFDGNGSHSGSSAERPAR